MGKALRVLGVEALPGAVRRPSAHRDGPARRTRPTHPRGDDVIAVVATGGTTNAGIIDDLAGVGRGRPGAVAVVPRGRGLRMRRPLRPVGPGPVRRHRAGRLVRGGSAQVAVRPLRLRRPHLPASPTWPRRSTPRTPPTSTCSTATTPDDWNPSDYAYHLTRRARGLPLWFSLAVNGTDAYRDAIETVLAVTQQAADLIERPPHLELVRRPELSVVLFRRPAGTGTTTSAGHADPRRPDRLRGPDHLGGRAGRPAGAAPPGHHHRPSIEEIIATTY